VTPRERGVADELVGALLFSMFGLCVEVAFTGLKAGVGGSFIGGVSLLMVPVYALAYLLIGPLLRLARRRDLMRPLLRIPLTVAGIYAIEWSFGAAYQSLGLRPWHYQHGWASDFSGGHITLLYAPFWALFAAILVPVHRAVQDAAPRMRAALRSGA